MAFKWVKHYFSGEFSRAFREWPTYPLTSLLLGTAFIHLSCQKFHKTRHTSILHVSQGIDPLDHDSSLIHQRNLAFSAHCS